MAAGEAHAQFALVFEYRVPEEGLATFERVYGSDGEWARFFRRDDAYRGTELWALDGQPGRYVVVDRWESDAAYGAFRAAHAAESDARSARCAGLYADERLVGTFRLIGPGHR